MEILFDLQAGGLEFRSLNPCLSLEGWWQPVIPALGRQRQGIPGWQGRAMDGVGEVSWLAHPARVSKLPVD